ncbi:MAG TPA: hypothetical protein VJP86_13930 [Vicinamibacterales bacterium]|jgi:Cu/Ag efflux protein CusF|nr:hypothetical protein [Vicinamibacterales bacterium]
MKSTICAVVLAALIALPIGLAAQKPVTRGAEVSATFTITAIDKTNRIVTLKDSKGLSEDMYCGPEVQRFNELKVGDRVTFRYYESVVSAISRPGAAPKPEVAGGMTRNTGAPGATISKQQVATVTLEAIDTKAPSVTVKTSDGRTIAFQIEDPKALAGYKVGDKVDITYTQALAINVTPAK